MEAKKTLILEVKDLKKYFKSPRGNVHAVDGVNFTSERGKTLGVVAKMCDDVAIVYAGRIVESGTLEDVFNHTMHPYTEGLFNSLPNIENREAELKPIPGLMPDPTHLPEGCTFAPRCPHAGSRCRQEAPPILTPEEGRSVRCWLYAGEGGAEA